MSFADLILSPFADLPVYWWLPLAAVALDRLIGDPPRAPHPVRLIGAFLSHLEAVMRRITRAEFAAGFASVVIVIALVWAVARGLVGLPFFLGLAAAVYLSYAGLALGQLVREGDAAVTLLENGDIAAARRAVGFLVSRDVSGADHDELCRVLAESLSENMNDGFVAPLFWLVLTGPVGLWLYKAASTMDSMWGYPYSPWTRFGAAAARLDDVMAYIPARFTAVFLIFAARRLKIIARCPSLGGMRADAARMKSPNAGWPMAACAWIHGSAMGGKAIYAGEVVEKPLLGAPGSEAVPWTTDKLRHLILHLEISAFLATACFWIGGLALHLLFW